jgi:peptide/nickel transport system permease protein
MSNLSHVVLRRAFFGVLTLFATSLLVFAATEILPGDVATAILGQTATPDMIAAIREKLGLDLPLAQRYVDWLGGFVSGNMGNSLATNADVATVIAPRLWNTLGVAAYAAAVAIPLSIGLGVLCAAWHQSIFDRTLSSVSVFLVSVPEFVIAVILVVILAVELKLFPSVVVRPNWHNPLTFMWQLFLPMATIVFTMLAHLIRMTRATLLEVLASPYAEMALLKGASKWRILFRHALPNAIGPVLSVIALNIGYLISGVAVIEVVFSYPGLGKLMVDSIFYRDLPLIQATAMIFCTVYVLCNTLADLSAAVLNPRIGQAA